MAFRCSAGLDIAGTDRNGNRFSVARGVALALYHRIKAIFPEAVIFFPFPLDESQFLAFADDSLASRIMLDCGVILSALGWLSLRAGGAGCWGVRHRLRRHVYSDRSRYEKRG